MRKYLIAGNWKMHGLIGQINVLLDHIKKGAGQYADVDILVMPTFVHLAYVNELLNESNITLGAQNLYLGPEGAFTGEVAGPMLKEIGCQYVLIGHSERRTLFHEDLSLVAAKCKTALDAGLKTIICVGETKAERENGETEKVVCRQLESIIDVIGMEALHHAVIAYEPVWAIGTGLTATPKEAQEVHSFIRHLIAQNNVDIATTIRILYGGSMKAANAQALLSMPDIDGGLIGGASLDAASFLQICAAASHEFEMAKSIN